MWLDSAVLVQGLANLLQKRVEIPPFEQSVAFGWIAMHRDFAAFRPFAERVLRYAKDVGGFGSLEAVG